VGDAWVPPSLEAELNVRQIVQLKRLCATPCDKCIGFGRIKCPKCDGTGSILCDNKGCKNGYIVSEKDGKLSPGKLRSTTKCPVCMGKGKISCEECNGNGNIICDKCGGTGERALCSRCNGNGFVFAGEKMIICPACGGDGHKR